MDEDWSLPGYEVQGRLGDGTGEDLWRGRELATGEVVVLCLLSEDVPSTTVAVWRQEAALQARVASPHLLRLRSVVEHAGRTVLVRDHAAGGGLAPLLARRGALDPGEVVTVGVALADALAALHGAGLVAGGVAEDRVQFRSDGMPLLLAVQGSAPEQAQDAVADVVALALLCGRLAGPGAPPELAAVLSAGAAGAHDAPAFGAALRRTCPAAPVRRGAAPPRTAVPPVLERTPRHAAVSDPRGRPRTGVLLAVAAVLLVLAGGLAGAWSARSGQADPAPPAARAHAARTSGDPTSARDWAEVLDRLDAARARALSQGDEALLAAAYAPGSSGLAADRRLVRTLASQGLTAHHVRHGVRQVQVLRASGEDARLRVVDVLGAYDVRDDGGRVVSRSPPRGEEAHVVELRRTSGGWRLVEIRKS